MYCTTCELVTDDLSHYKSQHHAINIRRLQAGYTPLTLEELESDSRTDDFAVDLHHNHGPPAAEPGAVKHAQAAPPKQALCLFCEQPEAPAHYQEHGMDREQITYIMNKQCYVCYERFVSKELLLKHLDSGSHRTSYTDGTSLFLSNGTTLHPPPRHMDIQPVGLRPKENTAERKVVDRQYEQMMDIKRLGELKCGIHNGHNFVKKPF